MKRQITIFLATIFSATIANADLSLTPTTPIRIIAAGEQAEHLYLAAEPIDKYLRAVQQRETLDGQGDPVTITLKADALAWTSLPAHRRKSLGDIDGFTITIDEAKRNITLNGSTVLSTCFAAYQFLEDHVGVTFLFPGDLGVGLPRSTTIQLQPGEKRYAPDVTSRLYTGLIYGGSPNKLAFRRTYKRTHPLFLERHFFEAHDYARSLKLHFLASPSHNMINIVTPQMAREDPELAPMLEDGTRYQPADKSDQGRGRSHQAWHPCYTDAKTVDITIEKARTAFKGGRMCFSLGINDGRRVQCQCDECKQVGWPMSYYQYVSRVAEALKDHYPPHVVGVLVYGDVRQPPEDLDLPDNVLCMVSGHSTLRKWSGHADHIGRYGYFFGHGFYVPSFPMRAIKHNAEVFRNFNVRSFRAEAHPVWAFDGPKMYIQSKLLWDLNLDVDAALRHWCDAAFGDGGEAMARLYQRWASTWDYLVNRRDASEPAPYCDMGLWRKSFAQFARVSPDIYAFTQACIDEARSLVRPGLETDRLDMVATHFEYSRHLFNTQYTVQEIFAARNDQSADLAQVFADLQHSRERSRALKEQVETTEAWNLGAGRNKDLEGYESIDQNMYAGLLTALMRLRESGKMTEATINALPPAFIPIARGGMSAKPIRKIKVMDKGWYWTLPRVQYMFEPFDVTSEGGSFRAVKKAETPVIQIGTREGRYEQHWAFTMIPLRSEASDRRLFRFDIELTGKHGVLNLFVGNPWRANPDDGVPVNASVIFDDESTTKTLSFTVEPLTPKSEHYGKATAMRFGFLFTPAEDDAACEVTGDVTEITITPETNP